MATTTTPTTTATTTTAAAADATREAEDVATLESYRVKSDGVATKTYMDQFECEQSCGMFFFPLEELPEDQQVQLQQSGFTNAALEVMLSNASICVGRESCTHECCCAYVSRALSSHG